MVRENVIIKNPTGLHLRPAGLFCKTAMQFGCKVMIEKKVKAGVSSANAKSVLSVLGACIKSGDQIAIVSEVEDEEAALEEMVRIVEDGLGE